MSKENDYAGKFKEATTKKFMKKFKADTKIKEDSQDLKMT